MKTSDLALLIGAVLLPERGKLPAVAAIILNGVPLLAGAWFVWWLFFGVRI